MSRNKIRAIAYLRTSSAANIGSDKDSDKRQRAAIQGFAKGNGYEIVAEFYDAGVSGADVVTARPGFLAMLDRIAGNGVRTIIVESPDRFARDLAVQLAGHDYLKGLGIALIPASAPDFFLEDTPTAVLVRQVLGAIAQFEKASLVAKLKAARERKRKATERSEQRNQQREPVSAARSRKCRGDRELNSATPVAGPDFLTCARRMVRRRSPTVAPNQRKSLRCAVYTRKSSPWNAAKVEL
jgi:DNA invertase Pin-like site-specific DNA recombinase